MSKAIEVAKAKAARMARQLGAELGDFYSISETDQDDLAVNPTLYSSPPRKVFEPGKIDVSARIQVVFKISAKK